MKLFIVSLKEKMLLFILSFILCLFCGAGHHYSYAQDWRPIPETNNFFDASRVIRMSSEIIRVWERYVLIDESLDYIRKQGLSGDYIDYSYSIALLQIDCKKWLHGFVSIHNFNSRGNPTGPSVNFKDAEIEMTPAAPGTNADALIKVVCNLSDKRKKKK